MLFRAFPPHSTFDQNLFRNVQLFIYKEEPAQTSPGLVVSGGLVAISISIFTSQLEKAREATDLANIRSAYAECTTAVLTGEADDGVTEDKDTGAYSKSVDISQIKAGCLSSNADVKIGWKRSKPFYMATRGWS